MIIASIECTNQILPILDKSQLKTELSETDQNTLNSLVSIDDKNRMLASRFLLSKLLKKLKGDCLHLNQITFNQYGQPSLSGFFISISHSGQYVGVAVSNKEKIGLDIQKQDKINIIEYESFLSEEQIQELYKLNWKEKQKLFYKIWGDKEAIMKADGRGMGIDPKEIFLLKNQGYILNSKEKWFRIDSPQITGYSTSLYSNNPIYICRWYQFNNNLLIEYTFK